MREHPIPQDVTGYRFHIIGNMTLKQFVEVAAGVVVAIVLYKTNLIALVKWPLMLVSGGLGALIAWVPFEERPLDHWLTVFFGVLYHPTKFFWRKQAKIPEPFLFKPRQDQVNAPDVVDFTPARRARIQEYLSSVKSVQPKDDWETAEQDQIATILKTFDAVQVDKVSITKVAHKPTLNVRVRELQSFGEPEPQAPLVSESATIHVSELPIANPPVVAATQTEQIEEIETPNPVLEPILAPAPTITPTVTVFAAETIGDAAPINPPKIETPPTTTEPPTIETAGTTEIEVPELSFSEDTSSTPASATTPPQEAPVPSTSPESDQSFLMNQAPKSTTAPTEAVVTNAGLPFPTQPTIPNKMVGMVLDSTGKIVPNAIVEIKNLQGLVARAVKTNALGQFFITTPLENGTYVVTADKAGLDFDTQRLTLTGQIVAPLQLTATTSPQVVSPPLA